MKWKMLQIALWQRDLVWNVRPAEVLKTAFKTADFNRWAIRVGILASERRSFLALREVEVLELRLSAKAMAAGIQFTRAHRPAHNLWLEARIAQ